MKKRQIILTTAVEITEIIKPTSAKTFGKLKVGDVLKIHLVVPIVEINEGTPSKDEKMRQNKSVQIEVNGEMREGMDTKTLAKRMGNFNFIYLYEEIEMEAKIKFTKESLTR